MPFDDAAAYARFMGRFSEPLALAFVDALGLAPGERVLDVGCGGGALTAALAVRLGPGGVAACDPSEPFVRAARERLPEVEVRVAEAERLPYADDGFDVVAAQLVVQFMRDPVAGVTEMARVARPGGQVAASVWDAEQGPLSVVARAARDLDPAAPGRSTLTGSRADLLDLAGRAGLLDVATRSLDVTVGFDSFEAWWAPYPLPVGPLGDYLARLPADHLRRVRDACAQAMPEPPFEVTVRALVVTGRA